MRRLALAALLGVLVLALVGHASADRFVRVARKAPVRMHESFARLQSLADDGSTATIAVHPMQFLNEVNAWRREVGAPPLEWDESVAKVSEEWAAGLEAEECALEKPTAEWTAEKYAEAGGVLEPLGVNVAFACCEDPAPQTGEEIVDMWASEKKNYAFGPSGDACTVTKEEAAEEKPKAEPAASRRRLLGARAGRTGRGWSQLTLQPVAGPPIDPAYQKGSKYGPQEGPAAVGLGEPKAGAEPTGEEHVVEEEPEEEPEVQEKGEGEGEEGEGQGDDLSWFKDVAEAAPREEGEEEEEQPTEGEKTEEEEEEEEPEEEPEHAEEEEKEEEEPEHEEATKEGEEEEEPEEGEEEETPGEEGEEEEEEEPKVEEEEEKPEAEGEEHEEPVEEEKEEEEEEPEGEEEEEKEPEEEEEKPEAEEEEGKQPEEEEEPEAEEEEEKEPEEEEKEEPEEEGEEEKPVEEEGGEMSVEHYTQMVWAKTEKMGCAVAQCGDKGTVWVCSFWPAGNVAGELPFCKQNVPDGMPECEGLVEESGDDSEMPCVKPEGECGFEAECCSCEEGEDEEEKGEEEEKEGEEDEKEGEEMEKQGELKGDEEEEEEGKEEEKEGEEEEKEGEEEEKVGKEEEEQEEEEKAEEVKEEEEAKEEEEVKTVVHLKGVKEADFDAVKFQEVVAESLGLPLFKVEVGKPSTTPPKRRLLSEDLYVPVTLKCAEDECGELESKLTGLECNGELASSLGGGVETGCPEEEGQEGEEEEEEPEEEERGGEEEEVERPEEAEEPAEEAAERQEEEAGEEPAARAGGAAPEEEGEEGGEEEGEEGGEEGEEEEGEEGGERVTFPDAFPNSVRHWLLIGMLMMFVGLVVTFVFTFVPSREMPMANVLCFIICGVAMCAYYCMWAGVGVVFKTTDVTPRVIFYPKYLDWVITAPLIVIVLALLAAAKAPVMVALVGNAILFVLCMLVGATLVAPYKYMWWIVGMLFYLILLLILFRAQKKSSSSTLRTLSILTFLSWSLYPFLWLLGMEGTGALGLSQQVALTTILDLIAKVVFAVIVVTSPQDTYAEDEEEERVMRTRFSTVM